MEDSFKCVFCSKKGFFPSNIDSAGKTIQVCNDGVFIWFKSSWKYICSEDIYRAIWNSNCKN